MRNVFFLFSSFRRRLELRGISLNLKLLESAGLVGGAKFRGRTLISYAACKKVLKMYDAVCFMNEIFSSPTFQRFVCLECKTCKGLFFASEGEECDTCSMCFGKITDDYEAEALQIRGPRTAVINGCKCVEVARGRSPECLVCPWYNKCLDFFAKENWFGWRVVEKKIKNKHPKRKVFA